MFEDEDDPKILLEDVQRLLDGSADSVLYLKDGLDGWEVDVRPRGSVDVRAVIVSREDLLDLLQGDEVTEDHYLPDLQGRVNNLIGPLVAPDAFGENV